MPNEDFQEELYDEYNDCDGLLTSINKESKLKKIALNAGAGLIITANTAMADKLVDHRYKDPIINSSGQVIGEDEHRVFMDITGPDRFLVGKKAPYEVKIVGDDGLDYVLLVVGSDNEKLPENPGWKGFLNGDDSFLPGVGSPAIITNRNKSIRDRLPEWTSDKNTTAYFSATGKRGITYTVPVHVTGDGDVKFCAIIGTQIQSPVLSYTAHVDTPDILSIDDADLGDITVNEVLLTEDILNSYLPENLHNLDLITKLHCVLNQTYKHTRETIERQRNGERGNVIKYSNLPDVDLRRAYGSISQDENHIFVFGARLCQETYSPEPAESHIYILDKSFRKIYEQNLGCGRKVHNGSWSGDNKTVAFGTSNSDNSNGNINLIDVNGRYTLIDTPKQDEIKPMFSPGGDKIIYLVRNGSGMDIGMMDIDDHSTRLLTGGGQVASEDEQNYFDFTYDGSNILYAKNDGMLYLLQIDIRPRLSMH